MADPLNPWASPAYANRDDITFALMQNRLLNGPQVDTPAGVNNGVTSPDQPLVGPMGLPVAGGTRASWNARPLGENEVYNPTSGFTPWDYKPPPSQTSPWDYKPPAVSPTAPAAPANPAVPTSTELGATTNPTFANVQAGSWKPNVRGGFYGNAIGGENNINGMGSLADLSASPTTPAPSTPAAPPPFQSGQWGAMNQTPIGSKGVGQTPPQGSPV